MEGEVPRGTMMGSPMNPVAGTMAMPVASPLTPLRVSDAAVVGINSMTALLPEGGLSAVKVLAPISDTVSRLMVPGAHRCRAS